MTIDAKGNVASYDNYYPFGEIMPGLSSNTAIADAKYKFTGKERDVETGLDYFGARYYESWSGRWMSVDPLAEKYPGWSPYNYGIDNPLLLIDINGDSVVTIDNQKYIQPTQLTVTPENQGQTTTNVLPSMTTKFPVVRTDLPFLKVETYTEASASGGKSIGFTINAITGNLESTTYTTSGGEKTTIGTSGSFTIGFSSFAVGETSDRKYVVDLSMSTGSNTRTGTTIYVDSPTALAQQAASGLENILSFFAKFAPSNPLPIPPIMYPAPIF